MNYVRVLSFTIMAVCLALPLEAATATWDRNPEADVTGYRLSYGTQTGVHDVSIDVGNVITFQFSPPGGRRYYIVVQAYNLSGALGPKSDEIIFDAPATINQPPLLAQPANQSSLRNTQQSLTLAASDPEGSPIVFGASGLPPGLALNTATGVMAGTVTTVGAYTVTATASDGALTVSRTLTWTVTDPADTTPPTVAMATPANNATVSGTSVAVTATAADAVGVVGVQFRLDGANLGVEDTVAPYSVTWNTTLATNASHVLTAVARDAAGNSRTATAITVTVSNTVANRAPTLAQPANQSGAEAYAVSLALSGSDPDGNPLTYSASGLPRGLSVNSTSGLISGTPTYTSSGSYTVTARVSDGTLSQSRSFSWLIANTNRKPRLTSPVNQSSEADSEVSLQLVASDPDGTALTYQATNLPSELELDPSTGLISGTLSAESVGVHSVVVTVTDGAMSESQTFVWSVNGPDDPIRGDFDGDGRADPASYRATNGEWRFWLSANSFVLAGPVRWGATGDIPVPADYDGDRRTDIAIYRPATGRWHVLLSSTNFKTTLDIQWGDASDRPMPIDYDNDGKADLALPRSGGFDILLSRSNYANSVTVR